MQPLATILKPLHPSLPFIAASQFTLMEPFEEGCHLSFLAGYTPSFLSPGGKSGLLHLWNSPNATTLKKINVISPTLIQLQQLF